MAISKARFRNCRTHKDLTIDFQPFTAIKGENNAGKTGIHKTLNACLMNKNIPASSIRRGSSEMIVEVWFEDGRYLRRHRTKTGHRIVLMRGEEVILDGTTFKDATDTVREFTRFFPVKLSPNDDEEDVQFVKSSDPHNFLFNKAPATIFSIVSRLGSAHGIEKAAHKLKLSLQSLTKQTADARDTMIKHSHLLEAVDGLTGMRSVQTQLEDIRLLETNLNFGKSLIQSCSEVVKLQLPKLKPVLLEVGNLLALKKNKSDLSTILTKLSKLVDEHSISDLPNLQILSTHQSRFTEVKAILLSLTEVLSLDSQISELTKELASLPKPTICAECGGTYYP